MPAAAPPIARPPGLFGNGLDANFRSCVKMVESVILGLGLQPDANRLPTPSRNPAWGLMRGSAAVYIFVQPGEQANYLQVVSPVVKLPRDRLPELYRRLLELNATELIGASFGVRGDDVVITADRSTLDLEESEVNEMIRRVGLYSDRYDDEFAAKYGARRHSDVARGQ